MLRFTSVLVLLALAGQCSYGQPTHDDSVLDDFIHWRDGHELLEQMMTYMERVVVHQEQQQRAQDERMERLEQMLNESIEGQRRLEMQVNQQGKSVENITAMLAEIEGTCVSVKSSVNSVEEILTEEFQEQRQSALTNAQLLGAVNQTCVTSAEHYLEKHNNVSTQLQAIRDNIRRLTCLSPSALRDCSEIFNCGGRSDGIYTVYLGTALRRVEVYCDMTTDGGGWTVFQRRQDGSVDFYRNWNDYRTGFGNVEGEFWLGNDNLHLLTSGTRQRLRVDLGDFEGNTRYAEYDNFKVDSAEEKYALVSVGTYSGTAGDSMWWHRGRMFSTRDQDNDVWPRSCAQTYKGAWWYGACHHSNLNGRYLRGEHTSYADGVNWGSWTGENYSLRFTEMKIRPFNA